MDSSALGVEDLQACNLTLRDMGGAYRVDCERRWNFHGRIQASRIGALVLADVSVSPCTVRRDLDSGASVAAYYSLVVQVEGAARMRQCGSEAVLQPGDCTIIDSRYMSEFEAIRGFRQCAVSIPAAPVRERLRRGGIPLAQTVSGARGRGRLLADMVGSCWRNAADLQGIDLMATAVDMLLVATGSGHVVDDGRTARAPGREDFEQFIDANIERHDLTPELIARRFGVSVRQLYRLTMASGNTPASLIWSRRLARARRLLSQSGRGVRVIDVALDCGFKDGAHFSRAYRREFGHPPRESRQLRS